MPDKMLTRSQTILSSFNAEERTVEVILATETPVRRRSYAEGPFDEILVISRAAIDASRLDTMALLDSHDAHSGLDSRLGSIVPGSLRLEGSKALVTVKISRTEKGDRIVADLADGHRFGASVGYKILELDRVEATDDSVAQIRATRWQPMELSLVSIPADAASHTRSEIQENDMTTETTTPTITRAEQTRQSEIQTLARTARFNGDEEFVREALDGDTTVDQFRSVLLDKVVERSEKVQIFPHVETRGMRDLDRERSQAQQDSIYCRMSGARPSDAAREFMDYTLIDHAKEILTANGVETRGMTRDEVLNYRMGGMHTTSDFPQLLQNSGLRVLQDAYEAAQSPLKTILSRESRISDFRSKTILKTTDTGRLEKVNESGEVKATTRGEASEGYGLATYGRIFSMSRQMMLNDDLNAFGDWSIQAGRMAALTESHLLLQLLLSNPVMNETGQQLFSSAHKNLLSGSTLDKTNLTAARKLMREQTAPGGTVRINSTPKYLLVGPELESDAESLLATISPTTTEEVNPFAGKLELLIEPNIEDESWYVFASPSTAPVLEHAYLTSAPGPQIATKDGFEVLGMNFRTILDFGCGAVDFRGAIKNPGTE